MSTVLWGKRRGDVQYGSRDFWRRNVPIGAEVIVVGNHVYWDVGDVLDAYTAGWTGGPTGEHLRVVGLEGPRVGVIRL